MERTRNSSPRILITVGVALCCLTAGPSFGQTADQQLLEQAREAIKGSRGQSLPTDAKGADRYATPDLFKEDPLSEADAARSRPMSEQEIFERPSWMPRDSIQPIPRPGSHALRPFGYDLFAQRGGGPADIYASVVPEEYRLGTGDHLLVNVWGRVDLELQLTIDRSGRVFIPKAGKVMLSGMTVAQASSAIRAKLKTVYSSFELSVTVGQLRTFRVFVFGEVRRPGAYAVKAAGTLVDALYLAGGPNQRGTLRQVRLVRGDSTITIDLYEFLLSGRRGSDPHLQAGDVVFVDVAGPRAVARGQVKRPGIYEIKGGTSLREFIELAGGFDADAYRDRIMIDRLQAVDGRELLDVNLTGDSVVSGWETSVLDGDDVSVFSMYESRPNVVWLEGWVKHPGAFELRDSMRIGDLIDMGDQLKPGTYLKRADLLRKTSSDAWQMIAINLGSIIDGEADEDLRSGDRLIVYSSEDVQRPKQVWIEGEVRHPGEYELYEAMRLSDVVFSAGNPSRDALLTHVEVARRNQAGETQILSCDLDAVLNKGDLSMDLVLKDGDHIFLRKDPLSRRQDLVAIEGEVRLPGRYSLLGGDETFYDVLQRAGGLTERAFPQGTIFIRQDISKESKQRNIEKILVKSQPLMEDSSGRMHRQELIDFDPESITRVVLDVPRILKDMGGKSDIVLRAGDHIIVPARPSGIQVLGAVASSGTIRFNPKWRVKDYIARAGGMMRSSDRGEIRLIRANGKVVECEGKNLRVELGDAVFVPPRIVNKTDWFKTVTQSVSIIGGIATTVFVVASLRY